MPSTSSPRHHHQRSPQQDKQQRTLASQHPTNRQSTIEQSSTPKRKRRTKSKTSCATPAESSLQKPLRGQSQEAVKKLTYCSPHGAGPKKKAITVSLYFMLRM